jgi:hypothetical protein
MTTARGEDRSGTRLLEKILAGMRIFDLCWRRTRSNKDTRLHPQVRDAIWMLDDDAQLAAHSEIAYRATDPRCASIPPSLLSAAADAAPVRSARS